jgi:hypothetical protein
MVGDEQPQCYLSAAERRQAVLSERLNETQRLVPAGADAAIRTAMRNILARPGSSVDYATV